MQVFALAAILLAQAVSSPSASAATPAPAATVSAEPLRCTRPTRCITAESAPIGTPIKIVIWNLGTSRGHLSPGAWFFIAAEDVVVNGRLIIVKGGKGGPLGTGHYLTFGPDCSSDTLAVDWMPTQDFQMLPVSFADPRTDAPNSLTVPMPHDAICNRTNVEATVYISGAPTLKMP